MAREEQPSTRQSASEAMPPLIHAMRNSFEGCLDIFLFRREGIERFDPSVAAMMRSFLVLAAVWPVSFFVDAMALRALGRGGEYGVLHYGAVTALGLVTVLLALYLLCKLEKRMDVLPRWISIGNWMGIAVIVPFAGMIAVMGGPWTESAGMLAGVLLTGFAVYIMACSAFVAAHLLCIPWWRAALYTLGIFIVQQAVPALAGL
ncbi:MAG: hypothetical protein HYU57_02725 [Micavibrio aeruginosavorus]|nr:hypothetical protein [Micavibrio aeruginosavorus]